jgi:hypothetical protein
MVTISRRLRIFVSPQQDSLDQVRRRTREVLNRPYNFEPKPPSWETMGLDPLVGYFKPFSQVTTMPVQETQVTRPLSLSGYKLNRIIAVVGGVLLGILVGYLIYQLFLTVYTLNGVVSPIPSSSAISNQPTSTGNFYSIPANGLASSIGSFSLDVWQKGSTFLVGQGQSVLQLFDTLLQRLFSLPQ